MPWRQITAPFQESLQARIDYTLATAAMSAPIWLPSMADVTNFFVMLTAIGGFVLVVIRIWRAWHRRKSD